MEKKGGYGLFISLAIFSLVIFLLDQKGGFSFFRQAIEVITSPAQSKLHNLVTPKLNENLAEAAERVRILKKLEKENEDLRLQLGQHLSQKDATLVLAHVLSTGRFFILDKGSEDAVEVGQSVVFKNMLVGKIVVANQKVSRVLLPTEKDSVLQVKIRETGAKGLVKGQGDSMILSEVILSENLSEGDTLETIGSVDEKGLGIRPHLFIGKVSQIRKSDNQLFWEAKVTPFLAYQDLENVFVIE